MCVYRGSFGTNSSRFKYPLESETLGIIHVSYIAQIHAHAWILFLPNITSPRSRLTTLYVLSPILCGIWYKWSGIYTHVRADNESESTGKMESNMGEHGEEVREGKGRDVIGSLMREGGESELPGVNGGRSAVVNFPCVSIPYVSRCDRTRLKHGDGIGRGFPPTFSTLGLNQKHCQNTTSLPRLAAVLISSVFREPQ